MDSSEAAETKTIITGLLISSPLKCTIQQLCKDFLNTVGYELPFRRLGFTSPEEYLRSIPDTVRIHGSGCRAEVLPVIKEKSAHINELVAKQKKTSVPNHKKKYIKKFHDFHQPSTSRHNSNYSPQNGSSNRSFKQPHYKPSLSNDQNNESERQQNSDYNEQNSRPSLYFNKVSLEEQRQSSSSSSPCSYKEKHETCDEKKEKDHKADSVSSSDYDEYEIKVPPNIQNRLKKLILKFPNGLRTTEVLVEYQKMFGKKLRYENYNYRSVIEMCSDLPEIFRYIEETSDDFLLYDRSKPVPCLNQNELTTETVQNKENIGDDILRELPKIDWATSLNFVPSDVLHLSDRIPRYFPKDLQIGDYIDISIGEIYDISKFWVYMTFGELTPLMEELQNFFNHQRNKYLIPEFLLEVGLYCITLYADQYHRAVIVDLLPKFPDLVKVLFVDYGTVGNISNKEIWFLPKQFGKVPCQAMRSRLANIYPIYENRTWPIQSVNRFKQLVTNVPLVGEVTRIDEDDHVLEIYLADITNENRIFFINDVLVEDGHALYISQEQKKSLVDPNCHPVVKYIHLYPEFSEIESGNAPTTLEMNYIITNKIPLHHFYPHYFEIYYDEDIDYIVKQHEIFNKDPSTPPIKPVAEKFEYSKDFDFSFFPDEILDEIKELVKEEEANVKAKTVKTNEIVPKLEQSVGEAAKKESVLGYRCNKKRISELISGGSENKSTTFNSSSSSLELSLNNKLQNMSLNNSDLPVINNVTKPINSTNPFLSDEATVDANPFRATNPFLGDLEQSINTKDLFEIYAKPFKNKVNNLNTSNESPTKINKEINVSTSESLAATNTALIPKGEGQQRVRTPPGFNSGPPPINPSWDSNMFNPAYFNNFYNNPYYQRYLQFPNMFNVNMNQTGAEMIPPMPPPFIPNRYQFNLHYFQQFPHNFGPPMPSMPPVNMPMMNLNPTYKK